MLRGVKMDNYFSSCCDAEGYLEEALPRSNCSHRLFLSDIKTWWERYIAASAQLNEMVRKRAVSNARNTAYKMDQLYLNQIERTRKNILFQIYFPQLLYFLS